MQKISTGADIFDDFLEGGYDTDTLTTIYGPSSSGKTTLCMLCSIHLAREKKKVIYIDTESGFSIERLKQLSGSDFNEVLKHIIILKPSTFQEQSSTLEKLRLLITDKISLVVIDTLTAFYRLELAKSDDVREINKKLISQVSFLSEISNKKKLPVLITNQVYSDFEKKDDVKMVGGNILRYNSKTLIKLSSQNSRRKAEIISHRSIPEGKTADFAIINEGIIHA